jgi:hypothetical protein
MLHPPPHGRERKRKKTLGSVLGAAVVLSRPKRRYVSGAHVRSFSVLTVVFPSTSFPYPSISSSFFVNFLFRVHNKVKFKVCSGRNNFSDTQLRFVSLTFIAISFES